MKHKFAAILLTLLSTTVAQAGLGERCEPQSTAIEYMDCLDSVELFPTDTDSTNQRVIKSELVLEHTQLASAQCLGAAMVSTQAFRDCLWGHLSRQAETVEEVTQVALVQCFGITDPQAFRDCAFGDFTIRL